MVQSHTLLKPFHKKLLVGTYKTDLILKEKNKRNRQVSMHLYWEHAIPETNQIHLYCSLLTCPYGPFKLNFRPVKSRNHRYIEATDLWTVSWHNSIQIQPTASSMDEVTAHWKPILSSLLLQWSRNAMLLHYIMMKFYSTFSHLHSIFLFMLIFISPAALSEKMPVLWCHITSLKHYTLYSMKTLKKIPAATFLYLIF